MQPIRHSRTLLVGLTALLLAACDPAPAPSPSAGPVASPAVSPGPSPRASETASVPPTAMPSPVALDPITPASDVTVARLKVGNDLVAPQLAVVIYADGSLVSLKSMPPSVVRLSEAGLAAVVESFRASGLFAESHTIRSPSAPMGFGIYVLTFVDGEAPVTVRGTNLGEDPESRALVTLAERLLDLDAWLPRTAFVDNDSREHPYLASATRVTTEFDELDELAWTNEAQRIDRVAWPLATPPEELGDTLPMPGTDRWLQCGIISGEDEYAIRQALAALKSESLGAASRTTAWYIWLRDPLLMRLTLHPYLPDEQPACVAGDMPARPPSLAKAPRPSMGALLAASAGGLTPGPTAPELVAFELRTADDATLAHVSYYADGTVLFYDPPAPGVGIGARRLSPAGLAAVQLALDDSGLLRGDYSEQVPDGAPDYHVYSIVKGSTILNGSDRGKDAKATAIAVLVRKLIDPMSWLPADAWVGGSSSMVAYRPASIRLIILAEAASPDPILPSVAAVDWPLGFTLLTFGRPSEELGNPAARTALISADDALAVTRALEVAGARPHGHVTTAEYHLADHDAGRFVRISLEIASGVWGP